MGYIVNDNSSEQTIYKDWQNNVINLRVHRRTVIVNTINVPFGIDFEGSLRTPDLFVPVVIPITDGKNKRNNSAIVGDWPIEWISVCNGLDGIKSLFNDLMFN